MDEKVASLMLIDPEILKKELVISLPILTESDIEMMLNVEEPSSDLSTSDDEEKDKPCLKRDHRRMNLLNNPNYGVILSFLDQFRSQINFKNYPLRIFEDNLICEKDKVSGRFIDFHLALLKKISPGKPAERTQFSESMTKFAYRFDHEDGEHLNEHGYSKARIETKLRLLKNLLELQFERNQTLKNIVAEKPANDISSKPFGRDRFGAWYWLFTDSNCFVRLFREDIDENRTWINLSKNSQELENIIKVLISDYVVRRKFPDWKFSRESFKSAPVSHRFEDQYGPNRSYLKEKSEESGFISVLFGSSTIKAEQINLDPVVNLDREIPTSPPTLTPPTSNVEVRRVSEDSSDQGSIGSEIINCNRFSISSSSNESKDESDSNEMSQEAEKLKDEDKDESTKDAISPVEARKEAMETEEANELKDDETKDAISPVEAPKETLETEEANKLKDDETKDAISPVEAPKETMEKEESKESKNEDSRDIISPSVSKEAMETEEAKDEICSNDTSKEVMETKKKPKSTKTNRKKTQQTTDVVIKQPSMEQGIKRKLVDYDDSESDISSEKTEETSQSSEEASVNNEIPDNSTDLPIALRRPRRSRRSFLSDQSGDSSSTNKTTSDSSRKKKSVDRNWKGPSQSSRSRSRRRRRNRKPHEGCSSSTSDERHPSEDDYSDESFPKSTESDKLLTGDLLGEVDEEDDCIPRRQAKTVAQCQDQFPGQSKPCIRCTQSDRPECLLLCEDCNDAYHLECLQPELISVPDDDWHCPLCEHKHLCDGLIGKLASLIKDEANLEMRRRLNVSKRRKRLTNVVVNVDRFVSEPEVKKAQPTKKTPSIDDDEKASTKKPTSSIDDDDVDSVYGCKNDENRKPSDQEEEVGENGKRRMRSCRRKAQNYSLDDYDKKIKAAMIDAGVNRDLIEHDSDDSDNVSLKRKPSKKRARYELDDDFDATDAKNGDADFMPTRRRTTTTSTRQVDEDSRTMTVHSRSINDDSRSDGRDHDDFNDYGISDEEIGFRNRRQSSTSSVPKKKSKSKSTKKTQEHKSLIISDEDTIPYDPSEGDVPPLANVKSEPTTDFAHNDFPANVFGGTEIVKNVYNKNRIVEKVVYTNEAAGLNKPRRQQKAAPKKKKPKIKEGNASDEEEDTRPPPARRLPAKKRRGSNDSSLDGADDDYERLAHKRRLFSHGKAIVRSSITGHIKRLLGQDEDDDDEEEGEEEEEEEEEQKEEGEEAKVEEEEEKGEEKKEKKEKAKKEKKDEPKKDTNNNNSKPTTTNSEYDEFRLSDDDDFPDDQEILITTGLINLKKPPPNAKKPLAPVRAPFMPSMQSYQFAMVDPTAQFEFTCLPEEPIGQPSDSEPVNGAQNPSN